MGSSARIGFDTGAPGGSKQPAHAPDADGTRQELWCEWCGEPATADDWSYVAQAVICPRCLEELTYASADPARCEMGLVGGRH